MVPRMLHVVPSTSPTQGQGQSGAKWHRRWPGRPYDSTQRAGSGEGRSLSSTIQDPAHLFQWSAGELLGRTSEINSKMRDVLYINTLSTLKYEIHPNSIVLLTFVNPSSWQNDASIPRRCAAALTVSSSNFGGTFVFLVCVVVN